MNDTSNWQNTCSISGLKLSIMNTARPIFRSPNREEAVGHAVRANYMYSAMADVAALTGDSAYLEAIGKIWENVAEKKLSITGGVGASPHGEAYGKNYELPNHPYNETCAAIANVYWNHRMFLLHGDSKYMDVLERSLYNGVISGLSLEGTLFFYPNTLQHDGETPFNQGENGRSPWFNCSCCPSNLSRFVPSVAGYAYATRGENIYVNLFMNSEVSFETRGSKADPFTAIQLSLGWEGPPGDPEQQSPRMRTFAFEYLDGLRTGQFRQICSASQTGRSRTFPLR